MASHDDSVQSAGPTAEGSAAGFPIVGLGASAGGLAAFESFFSGLPADAAPGMAFVLVQHLAPDHKSLLTELIQRFTRMQVFEVEDGMRVKPNCAYIIPPNHDLALLNGALHLLDAGAPRGQRLPIDHFFRSLARDQRERAIAIVLSGTGSDGTLGVRAVKAEGGMAMAQSPASAQFDGMPLNAIATGLIDYELPPEQMAAQLMAYARHAYTRLSAPGAATGMAQDQALQKIFILLRAQTGHDFSNYKPSTIQRRVERRMAVHQLSDIGAYVKYLQHMPAEVQALFRDLLIGVTHFFRDPEAFKVLEEQLIPRLFESKPAGGLIRVWSTGCSSGEEAYSLAILLQECMEKLRASYAVQIFATDIDGRAIAVARAGVYPASIAADLSPERLARFFVLEPDGSYRVHKGLRDMLVFSEQDLIKDPPFSKLDLISCRNLLIYLNAELQKRLIPLFHYALNPGGLLLLGSSEGVGEFGEMFTVLDRKGKLYQRKEGLHGLQRATLGRLAPLMPAVPAQPDPALIRGAGKSGYAAKPPLRALTEQTLLQHMVPASALVNAQGDILYLHGRTGMFLEPAPGEVGVSNIVKMAREGLRHELAKALQQVVAMPEVMRIPGLRVKTNGHFSVVNLTLRPIVATQPDAAGTMLYLVSMEELHEAALSAPLPAPAAQDGDPAPLHDASLRIEALTLELRAKEEYLQSTLEELGSSNEELKSSNEEMQSVNEELQSANEELETSKEELQSVNEELATVNTELHTKVLDLSRANNDMNNLLAGTGIGTVFVDHQLRILRFTPAAVQFINLIAGDIGRPIGHIVSNLIGYDHLVADVRAVLDTLSSKEVEVQVAGDRWCLMRVQPYRTLDNVIEGAVITFADITETAAAREALRAANERLLRLAVVVRDAHDAITVQGLDGRIQAWNPGAERLYGWSETEALQLSIADLTPADLRAQQQDRLERLGRAEMLPPAQTQRLTKSGEVRHVFIVSTPLLNASGQVYAVATTERATPAPAP
nr:chemotaxis protein CheB [uncultured Roseateles sp.]